MVFPLLTVTLYNDFPAEITVDALPEPPNAIDEVPGTKVLDASSVIFPVSEWGYDPRLTVPLYPAFIIISCAVHPAEQSHSIVDCVLSNVKLSVAEKVPKDQFVALFPSVDPVLTQ